MKTLRTLALMLTTIVSALTIGVLFPQLTKDFPKLKALTQKAKSLVTSAPADNPSRPVVVVGITNGPQLNAGQAEFLDTHRRRHDLLRDALQ